MFPYVFVDDDRESETYGQFSVRISESMSIDGFKSLKDAVDYMEKHKND